MTFGERSASLLTQLQMPAPTRAAAYEGVTFHARM
jgi:hypothetical protein